MRRKLIENLKRVEQRIADACGRVQRDPGEITLVAVTKSAALDLIRTLVDIGVTDLGENRVQELARRAAAVQEWLSRRVREPHTPVPPRWHMIGHLQRNKVNAVLPWVTMIHSVDSLRLAEEIDAESGRANVRAQILLEVNAADEPQKHGVAVAATTHLAEQIQTLKNVELRGLMAMAPLTDDTARIRATFERVRELFDEIRAERTCGAGFRELSLGMTQDFELAIEYGSTFVRIGSALFEGIPLAPQPVEVE
jgi:pyridoxal phosphate enzyme (YggS family)